METQRENVNATEVFASIEKQTLMDNTEADNHEAEVVPDKCENCDISSTVYLFRMVFQSAQKPDDDRKKQQSRLTWILTCILIAQVLWAMVLIPLIIFNKNVISSASLPFLSLLITAILGEVVAMAFVVVRFVFRSPISEMLDILKELIAHNK